MSIYLDHASATPIRREVLDKMLPLLCHFTGSPVGSHQDARRTGLLIEEARRTTLDCLGAESGTVQFTSGSSQGCEGAVLGLARTAGSGHIIASVDEDPGVLAACRVLQDEGYEVTLLSPESNGSLALESIEAAFTEDTFLVSLAAVNRFTGCRLPVSEVSTLCRERHVLFHLEWSLGCLFELDLDFIDALTLSSHLVGGPPGVGALWTREGLQFSCLECESQANIVGFTQALCYLTDERSDWVASFQGLREEFITLLDSQRFGYGLSKNSASHPAILNLSFDGLESPELAYQLDRWGVSVLETPYGVRLSFGRTTTRDDLEKTASALAAAVRTCFQQQQDEVAA